MRSERRWTLRFNCIYFCPLKVQFSPFPKHPKPQRIALAPLHSPYELTDTVWTWKTAEFITMSWKAITQTLTFKKSFWIIALNTVKRWNWLLKTVKWRSLIESWQVFCLENLDINLNMHICWTQTASSKRFSRFNGTRPTQAICLPEKSESKSCVLNHSYRLATSSISICAHSWASTTHWQSEWTAPKILEVHSA